MSNEILEPFDFTNFDICINYINGKQTNKTRFEANRTLDVLEIIYTDICGPFSVTTWSSQQYFMTFIDDFSRYSYLCLLYEKSQTLDMFKNFKIEVENQLGKRIKSIRSNCDGE